ncbi:MAG: glycoside hydrolase family 32 protein [Eubacteriales bacterium]|nr:glycoside hydrolase family 32 protein [Eubacteriales bacterium]
MEFGSEALRRARGYEKEKAAEIPAGEKPDFHMTPPVGWINDPNGFSCYKGEYHLFYQYHPYSTHWGPMHWGHSKTKDFITWEQLPCALAPDEAYDGQGCFSGTALQDGDRHVLIYTSVLEKQDADGNKIVRQTQSVAVGDGVNYEKLPCNPVITADLLPEGSSRVDFRDPKLWKQGDRFYTAVGSLSVDGSGQIALFSADHVDNWRFEKILDRCQNRYGKMWECPDFFSLEGKQVLIVSPQFMRAEGLEFHNGNNVLYMIGDYDEEKLSFVRDQAFQVDYGLDFYAPETLETPDGRRIMVGWLQSWDNYLTPGNQKWSGMMTIPRELHIRDGRLLQLPVRELESYHGKSVKSRAVTVEGGSFVPGRDPLPAKKEPGVEIEGIRGRQFDMTVEVGAGDYERFEIDLAEGHGFRTAVYYEPAAGVLTFDRTYSGCEHDTLCTRSMYVRPQRGKIKLRIVMDRMTVEIFANDGEQAMTCLTYTDSRADKIRFACKGRAECDVEFFELIKRM